MLTVRRLLETRSGPVWTIGPTTSALEAVAVMAEHDIGALVVLEGERMVGIFTERDIARKLARSTSLEGLQVRQFMTERVLYVRPDQSIEACMALMTEKHVRHLPVLEQERLIGIISIRDVVANLIASKSFIIEQLENYLYTIPPYERTSTVGLG